MPHYYPIVIPGGRSLAGDSLGFHAYSLRIDNLTNQWLLEETSLAWIPPYSLGTCLRLYGTGVAIILNQAPPGQPQLAPVLGEQTIGVYSDQLRTEVGATAVRQFTYVQAVSDLTQGPQPIAPNVGVDRLWADTQGRIHHLHSDGTDLILIDPSQTGVITTPMFAPTAALPLGGLLTGTTLNGSVALGGINNPNMIVDALIPAAKLAAGAALGNLTAHSITNTSETSFGGAISTTSGAMVLSGDTVIYTPASTADLLVLYGGSFLNSAVANNSFQLQMDSLTIPGAFPNTYTTPIAGYYSVLTISALIQAVTPVAHSIQMAWSCSAGTLAQVPGTYRHMSIVELKR